MACCSRRLCKNKNQAIKLIAICYQYYYSVMKTNIAMRSDSKTCVGSGNDVVFFTGLISSIDFIGILIFFFCNKTRYINDEANIIQIYLGLYEKKQL